jgi:hypothetical protein
MDRGSSYSVNIIAIVTEQKNELNRLGTKHELIKGWFNSSILQPATSNFINITEVNKAKDLSLRGIVALTTRGQVFHSCNCRGNCETKKCACFKSNLKCNSQPLP